MNSSQRVISLAAFKQPGPQFHDVHQHVFQALVQMHRCARALEQQPELAKAALRRSAQRAHSAQLVHVARSRTL